VKFFLLKGIIYDIIGNTNVHMFIKALARILGIRKEEKTNKQTNILSAQL
jgi:hypothetical protein